MMQVFRIEVLMPDFIWIFVVGSVLVFLPKTIIALTALMTLSTGFGLIVVFLSFAAPSQKGFSRALRRTVFLIAPARTANTYGL
jgi:hypothetical protein